MAAGTGNRARAHWCRAGEEPLRYLLPQSKGETINDDEKKQTNKKEKKNTKKKQGQVDNAEVMNLKGVYIYVIVRLKSSLVFQENVYVVVVYHF